MDGQRDTVIDLLRQAVRGKFWEIRWGAASDAAKAL